MAISTKNKPHAPRERNAGLAADSASTAPWTPPAVPDPSDRYAGWTIRYVTVIWLIGFAVLMLAALWDYVQIALRALHVL